jgi:hypothetical protein
VAHGSYVAGYLGRSQKNLRLSTGAIFLTETVPII